MFSFNMIDLTIIFSTKAFFIYMLARPDLSRIPYQKSIKGMGLEELENSRPMIALALALPQSFSD